MRDIPTRLEMLRREAGMTQKRLADAAGVRQSEVSMLENGRHLQMCLERIAAVLGFEGNPSDLLEEVR